jgi:hypothetical protein
VNAAWYTLSRGVDRLKDYGWQPIGGDPDDVRRRAEIKRVRRHQWADCVLEDLAKDTHPGLVLAHARDLGTVVYVACVPMADPPREEVGRVIRAALVGVADEPAGRAQLVAVAAASLTGGLDGRFPISYETDAEAGFTLDVEAWESLVAEYVAEYVGELPGRPAEGEYGREHEPPSPDPADLQDSPEMRERTAADLCALLADGGLEAMPDRVIVLRAPVRNTALLEDDPPWRSLAEEYVWEPPRGSTVRKPPGPKRRVPPIVKGSVSLLAGAAVVAGVIFGARPFSRPPPSTPSSRQSGTPSASAPQTPPSLSASPASPLPSSSSTSTSTSKANLKPQSPCRVGTRRVPCFGAPFIVRENQWS